MTGLPHARKVEPLWREAARLLFSGAGVILIIFLAVIVVGVDAGVIGFGGPVQ